MADHLIGLGISIVNITEDAVSSVLEEHYKTIKQIVLPSYKLTNKGIPKINNIETITSIVDSISPDIIHVWGMEKYWGLLATRGFIHGHFLLDIQGIRQSCGEVFEGGMSLPEILCSFRLKEWIRPSISILGIKKRNILWGKYEREMLSFYKNISTQSTWVRDQIFPFIQKDTRLFRTKICVRAPFLESEKWDVRDTLDDSVFVITTSASPLRGIHNVIKALGIIRKFKPGVHLYLAGDFDQNKPIWRKSGYVKYLEGLIRKLNLDQNITFLGRLNANQMVSWLKRVRVFIQPSFVESYSVALAEALCVGVPCVVAYSGAMPEISNNICDYYSPNDFVSCASKIYTLLDSIEPSIKMSEKEKGLSEIRVDGSKVAQLQLSIYNDVLNNA